MSIMRCIFAGCRKRSSITGNTSRRLTHRKSSSGWLSSMRSPIACRYFWMTKLMPWSRRRERVAPGRRFQQTSGVVKILPPKCGVHGVASTRLPDGRAGSLTTSPGGFCQAETVSSAPSLMARNSTDRTLLHGNATKACFRTIETMPMRPQPGFSGCSAELRAGRGSCRDRFFQFALRHRP